MVDEVGHMGVIPPHFTLINQEPSLFKSFIDIKEPGNSPCLFPEMGLDGCHNLIRSSGQGDPDFREIPYRR